MGEKTPAEIINCLKRENKMDNHGLSKRLGIRYNTFRGYLNENTTECKIPLEVIIKLADIFDVSVDYILGKTEIRKYNDKASLEKFMKEVIDNYFQSNPQKD